MNANMIGHSYIIDKDKKFKTQFFIQDERYNSVVTINGKKYRERVELLLFKGDRVYIGKKKDGTFVIPGGSTEPNTTWEEQVIKECEEEAFITPKNLKYIASYIRDFGNMNDKPAWMTTKKIDYNGTIVRVFVGEYGKKYAGYVDERDRSSAVANGKFISVEEALTGLNPVYAEIFNMLKETRNESMSLKALESAYVLGLVDEEIATEGFIKDKIEALKAKYKKNKELYKKSSDLFERDFEKIEANIYNLLNSVKNGEEWKSLPWNTEKMVDYGDYWFTVTPFSNKSLKLISRKPTFKDPKTKDCYDYIVQKLNDNLIERNRKDDQSEYTLKVESVQNNLIIIELVVND